MTGNDIAVGMVFTAPARIAATLFAQRGRKISPWVASCTIT